MDEAIGPIIIVFLVVALIIAAIVALLYAGLFVIATIAVIGTISGFVVAAKNFFEVLAEAHSKVPGAPGGNKWAEKGFVAFFVVALLLIGVIVGLRLRGGVASVSHAQPAMGRLAVAGRTRADVRPQALRPQAADHGCSDEYL